MLAKHSHKVWEGLDHPFEKSHFRQKMRVLMHHLLIVIRVLESVTFFYV